MFYIFQINRKLYSFGDNDQNIMTASTCFSKVNYFLPFNAKSSLRKTNYYFKPAIYFQNDFSRQFLKLFRAIICEQSEETSKQCGKFHGDSGVYKLFNPDSSCKKNFAKQPPVKYTMVAKSDVQLKIKSYSVCEELFIFILNRK